MIITFGYIKKNWKKQTNKKKKKTPCIEVAVPRPAAVKSAD
jgi:hypothetical protein